MSLPLKPKPTLSLNSFVNNPLTSGLVGAALSNTAVQSVVAPLIAPVVQPLTQVALPPVVQAMVPPALQQMVAPNFNNAAHDAMAAPGGGLVNAIANIAAQAPALPHGQKLRQKYFIVDDIVVQLVANTITATRFIIDIPNAVRICPKSVKIETFPCAPSGADICAHMWGHVFLGDRVAILTTEGSPFITSGGLTITGCIGSAYSYTIWNNASKVIGQGDIGMREFQTYRSAGPDADGKFSVTASSYGAFQGGTTATRFIVEGYALVGE